MSKNKGFTLIEILVVMAILGILAGLMIVGMDLSRKKARIAKAHAETKQLVQAWKSYWLVYSAWPTVCDGQRNVPMDGSTMRILMGNNPQKLQFFEPNEKVVTEGFKDPWGGLYTVDFDLSASVGEPESYETAVFLPQCRRYSYDDLF